MSRSDAHRLQDMLMAADEIADIVGRGRAAFDSDPSQLWVIAVVNVPDVARQVRAIEAI